MNKFYFAALKAITAFLNLISRIFKLKVNMNELTGKEGQLVSEEAFDSLVKSYSDQHSEDKTFLTFSTIGIDQLRQVLVNDAVAVRIYNAFDGNEEKFLVVPVNAEGKELAIGRTDELARTSMAKALQSDPPHCPPRCK